jgi:hypothetical protein
MRRGHRYRVGMAVPPGARRYFRSRHFRSEFVVPVIVGLLVAGAGVLLGRALTASPAPNLELVDLRFDYVAGPVERPVRKYRTPEGRVVQARGIPRSRPSVATLDFRVRNRGDVVAVATSLDLRVLDFAPLISECRLAKSILAASARYDVALPWPDSVSDSVVGEGVELPLDQAIPSRAADRFIVRLGHEALRERTFRKARGSFFDPRAAEVAPPLGATVPETSGLYRLAVSIRQAPGERPVYVGTVVVATPAPSAVGDAYFARSPECRMELADKIEDFADRGGRVDPALADAVAFLRSGKAP